MKGKKTGGRQKGSKNRSVAEVKDLVDLIFAKIDPVEKSIKLLEFGSDKTQATVLLRLLEYRYGKPVQPVSGSLSLALEELPGILARARQRVTNADSRTQ